jgi:hypothetical protein
VADENLSLQIQFENFQQLLAQLEQVKASINAFKGLKPDVSGFKDLNLAIDRNIASLQRLRSVDPGSNVKSEPYRRLAAEANKAGAAVRKAGDKAKEAGQKQAEAARSTGRLTTAFANFKRIALGVFAALTGINVYNVLQRAQAALERQLKTAQRVFIETQAAILRFASGLQAVGRFSEEAVIGIQKYASAIQNATGISDDLVIQSASLIAQLGGLSGFALRRATNAAIELSKVLGLDLLTAALLVAKAAQGNTTQFQRYGFVIDKTIPKHKRFAFLLDDIQKKFEGTAELAAVGLGGSIDKLAKSWDDLLKALGGTFSVVAPEIDKVTAKIQEWVGQLDNQIDNAILAAESTRRFARELQELAVIFKFSNNQVLVEIQRFFSAFDEAGFPGGFFRAFSQSFRPDTVREMVEFLEREIGKIEVQADLIFRAGQAEGLDELIEAAELAKAAIRGFEIDLTVEGAAEAQETLERLFRRFDTLQKRALEAKPRRAEELFQEHLAALQELRDRAIPPIELKVLADFDQYKKDIADAQEELDKLANRRVTVVVPELVDADRPINARRREIQEGIDEATKGIPALQFGAAIELDPREIAKLTATEIDIRGNLLLEEGNTRAFINLLEALGEQADEFKRLSRSESGALIDPVALKRAQEFAKLYEVARAKLIAFNKETDRIEGIQRAQTFLDELAERQVTKFGVKVEGLGDVRALADIIGKADDELKALRDTTLEILSFSGAGLSEVIEVEDFGKDITQTDALLQRLRVSLAGLTDQFRNATPEEARIHLANLEQLYQSVSDAVARLRKEHGSLGPEMDQAFSFILSTIKSYVPLLEEAASETQKFSALLQVTFAEVGVFLSNTFDVAFDAITDKTIEFGNEMTAIFKAFLRDIAKTFAAIGFGKLISNLFGLPFNPLAPFAGLFSKAGTDGQTGQEPREEPEDIPLKPTFDVEIPEPLEVRPQFEVADPGTFALRPQFKLVDPETFALRPQFDVVDPGAFALHPQFEVADQQVFTLRPEFDLIQPSSLGIQPELKLVNPEALLVPTPQVSASPVAEFARLQRAQARATATREPPVVIRLPETTRQGGDTFNFNVEAFDGASVRSQFNHGPLQQQAARAARRRRVG